MVLVTNAMLLPTQSVLGVAIGTAPVLPRHRTNGVGASVALVLIAICTMR